MYNSNRDMCRPISTFLSAHVWLSLCQLISPSQKQMFTQCSYSIVTHIRGCQKCMTSYYRKIMNWANIDVFTELNNRYTFTILCFGSTNEHTLKQQESAEELGGKNYFLICFSVLSVPLKYWINFKTDLLFGISPRTPLQANLTGNKDQRNIWVK